MKPVIGNFTGNWLTDNRITTLHRANLQVAWQHASDLSPRGHWSTRQMLGRVSASECPTTTPPKSNQIKLSQSLKFSKIGPNFGRFLPSKNSGAAPKSCSQSYACHMENVLWSYSPLAPKLLLKLLGRPPSKVDIYSKRCSLSSACKNLRG